MKDQRTIPVDDGNSLQSIIDKARAMGWNDLSEVVLEYDYAGCSCEECAYAPSSYSDIRFELKPKKK